METVSNYCCLKGPAPYWSNFWHSGTLTLSAERQSAGMLEIKNGGLDQYDKV